MFDQLPAVKRIGIKMSGGVDSSLVAYLLVKHILDKKLDIKIYPIIIIERLSPFQELFAKPVIEFIENETGFYFESPFIFECAVDENKPKKMRQIESNLLKTDLDLIVAGTTQHPKTGFNEPGGPEESRVGNFPEIWDKVYIPFINKDKKELADLYKQYNLIDTLFPMTRSCVKVTENFDRHCGECWWCKERLWAFGKL